MPKISETGAGTVVDVCLGADDLGNHRQPADQRRAEVANTDRDDVAIHVRFAFPRIEQIDRFRTEQRLQASDDEEHHGPLPRFQFGQRGKVGRCDVIEHAEHAIRHADQILFAKLVLVALQRVGMLMQQIETHAHRDGDQQDDHRDWESTFSGPSFLAKTGQRNMIRMLTIPIAANRRIGFDNVVRKFLEHLQRLAASRNSQGDGKLLDDDDHANRRQHAVHGGDRKELAKNTGSEKAKEYLQDGCCDADRQCRFVGRHVSFDPATGHAVAAKVFDAADGNHDQTGSRTLDGQLAVADERRQDRADDRSEDAGDRRIATGERNPQAQRQGDQEDQKAGYEIVLEVSGEADEIAAWHLDSARLFA